PRQARTVKPTRDLSLTTRQFSQLGSVATPLVRHIQLLARIVDRRHRRRGRSLDLDAVPGPDLNASAHELLKIFRNCSRIRGNYSADELPRGLRVVGVPVGETRALHGLRGGSQAHLLPVRQRE